MSSPCSGISFSTPLLISSSLLCLVEIFLSNTKEKAQLRIDLFSYWQRLWKTEKRIKNPWQVFFPSALQKCSGFPGTLSHNFSHKRWDSSDPMSSAELGSVGLPSQSVGICTSRVKLNSSKHWHLIFKSTSLLMIGVTMSAQDTFTYSYRCFERQILLRASNVFGQVIKLLIE